MQLPVDVKALLEEFTNVKIARDEPIAVSVYIDGSASSELVAHVRNVFASSSPHVRMTVAYLDDSFFPHPTDDVAVVVAGTSKTVGKSAEALRGVGVPVMVVGENCEQVARIASDAGFAIPDGDIVSCDGARDDGLTSYAELDERMGRWIASVCRAKNLAFAIAFPFMRRPLAKDAVQLTAVENAAIGLIPVIPGADLPIMTLNQAKMVLQIAAAYGQDVDKNRLKELAFVLVGAYVSRGVVRRLVAAVPLLGFLFKTGVAYGTTAAVGYAVIEYFEGGEDATGVANVLERATEAGAKLAAVAQEKASELSSRLPAAASGQV